MSHFSLRIPLVLSAVLLTCTVAACGGPAPDESIAAETESSTQQGLAADDQCHDPSFGGNYVCSYGVRRTTLPDGTRQIFVIGTDYAVWTRWQKDGHFSNWVSMGGKAIEYGGSDYFILWNCVQPLLNVVGTDGYWYTNYRSSNGSWSGWVLGQGSCT